MKTRVNKIDLEYIKEDLQYIKESIKTDKILKEDLRKWFKEKWINEKICPTLVNENIEVSQALKSHLLSKIPLKETISTSDNLEQLLEEAKDLYMNGDLDLSDEDVKFIYESEYSIEETDFIPSNSLNEAEYQGRTVKLNKVMQGDVKKFKVYVKNDKGNVIKVNFGFGGKSAKGKVMKIKKDNPERRKSFRARHKCSTATDKTSARYWSCKMW